MSDNPFGLEITDTASKHFKALIEEQDSCLGVRFIVLNGGTSNAELQIEYHYGEDSNLVEMSINKLNVYCSKETGQFLQDAKIDFIDNGSESHLSIKAPNLKPSLEFLDGDTLRDKVEKFFSLEINNALAEHGGMVEIVDVQNNDLYLKFKGGCQGCSMVNITLKNGIESRIREMIPEIDNIIDVTNHEDGKQPYYN